MVWERESQLRQKDSMREASEKSHVFKETFLAFCVTFAAPDMALGSEVTPSN